MGFLGFGRKTYKAMNLGEFLSATIPRYIVMVIFGGFIAVFLTAILNWLQASFTGTFGLILATLVFLVIYLMVLKEHPGVENILTDVIPIFIFAPVVYGILGSFGITIPTLTTGLTVGLGLGTAITSILIADTVYLILRK